MRSEKISLYRCVLKRHSGPILFIVIGVLVAYPEWLMQGIPAFDDLSRLNVPQRILLSWIYQHGQLPLWNPYNFAGQPLLAAGQSGPLYIFNLLYLFLPIVIALKASYLVHELFAAISMYILVYDLGKQRLGAILSSLSFVTCGFFIGHQIHTQMFDAISWLPFITYCYFRILNGFGHTYTFLLGLSLALEIYAGHPQMTFYIVVYLALFTFLSFMTKSRPSIKALLSLCTAGAFGLGFSAPQWLTTLNLVSYSDRSAVSPSFLLNGSLPPIGLQQWLTPFAAGGGYSGLPFSTTDYIKTYHFPLFWEFTCYFGLIAFLLASSSILYAWKSSVLVRKLAISVVITTLFALGGYTEVGIWMTHLPGFDLFRIPARYVVLSDFSLSILAGLGLNLLQSNQNKLFKTILAYFSLVIALLVLVLHWTGTMPSATQTAIAIPITACVMIFAVSILSLQKTTEWLKWFLFSLAILDCISACASLSPFILRPAASYLQPSLAIQYLLQHTHGNPFPAQRVLAVPGTSLSHDKSAAYHLPSLDGYDSLEPAWYAQSINLTWTDENILYTMSTPLLNELGVQYILAPTNTSIVPKTSAPNHEWKQTLANLPRKTTGLQIIVSSNQQNLQNAYGPLFTIYIKNGIHQFTEKISGWPDAVYPISLPVQWPLKGATQIKLQNIRWRGSYQIDEIDCVNVNYPLTALKKIPVNKILGPKAWMAVCTTPSETLWKNPDTLHSAWLTNLPDSPNQPSLIGHVSLLSWTMNHSNWLIQSPHRTWFVLSQMYDPNWHAYINGKSVPIIPMHGVLTAIQVPSAGTFHVQFTYRPTSFVIGIVIFLFSAFCSIIWMVTSILRKQYRRI